ncbi:MAG: hypothetical protein LBE17_14775 [Treponema sp.]|nr:hypothetical protein [Treponema sp.]
MVPLEKKSDLTPFWKADAMFLSPVITRRILELLEELGMPEQLQAEVPAVRGISGTTLEELKFLIRSQE